MAEGSDTPTSKYTFTTFVNMYDKFDWSRVSGSECWKFLDDFNAVGNQVLNDLRKNSLTREEALTMTGKMKEIDAKSFKYCQECPPRAESHKTRIWGTNIWV